MSLIKDLNIETIRKLPESATAKDIINEIELIEDFRKFHNLTDILKEETLLTSSVHEIESKRSYLEIIGMGKKVLPYIFQDLKSEPAAIWFPALETITGYNPIKKDHRGIIKLMAEDWLRWEFL